MSTSERREPEIRSGALDAVLCFLPLFESAEFSFGEWHYPEGQMPHFAPSPEVITFVQALHAAGVIYPFDWPRWLDAAKAYMADVEAVGAADLVTLCKLLTTHVRRDRFHEGHLDYVFRTGHLTAILKQLKQITDQLDRTGHPGDNG